MVEEKYSNLQEEAVGKTKKLQKINQMYKSAKAEVRLLYPISGSTGFQARLINFVYFDFL